MAGYAADTTKTGAIAATDTLEQAFNKLENGIASATVKSTDKTVNITDNSGKDLSVNIDGTTLVKNTTSGVISSDLKIRKETTGLDTNVKEQYKLVYGSSTTAIGDVIKVYKDSSLKSVALNGQNLDFTYILADGTESTVSVDVSTFLAESEFKDGLQVNNGEVSVKVGDGIEYGSEASGNKSIKVKIDTASDDAENFLSVGANGVKISGVQDAIDTAIEALDVTDAAVAGQYVSAVNETDGKVSMTRANVSDAVLTGYDKGSSAPQSTAVAATDDVKTAISKLEWQVDAAKAAATAAHTSVEHATGNTHVTVSASQPDSNGKVTYTVNETNIADADDLAAEITARKAVDGQSGDTYTANTGTNYISGATSLNNADVQLDTALKTVDDAMLTQINGSNAIDVTTKASKQQTVSLKLDTATATGNITSDMLQITSNGLMMKDTWDCGVF